MVKTLTDMTKEVDEFCHDKGWRGNLTFGERMALLHSEVSEALEAYRDWGVEDKTIPNLPGNLPNKPEGVGSEYADILIRLLDDCAVYGVDLQEKVDGFAGRYAIPVTFGEQIEMLHRLAVYACNAHEDGIIGSFWGSVDIAFAHIYVFLTQIAEYNGIDLEAEYERKMAYNRTRPFRHGGKAL